MDVTLPSFINKHENEKVAFMHVDMDTYTPTKIMFETCVNNFQEGTIIVFDELLGYPGWKENEYKALTEIIAPKWDYEFISYCEPKSTNRKRSEFVRATIRITSPKNN